MPASKGDSLRKPNEAYLPDGRSSAFGLNNISDQHKKIEVYILEDYVPEKVVTQYEVARNIYLYAYNVYRFYMVAQHQALVALEFAIKECIGKEKIKLYGKKIKKGNGLAACLYYIFDKELIDNADFPIWQHRHRRDAEQKYMSEKSDEMDEKGLEKIELNYNEIVYEEYSLEWDYLKVLSKSMPDLRNMHAHGSTTLYNQVLLTFENVTTIINTIYNPKKHKEKSIEPDAID